MEPNHQAIQRLLDDSEALVVVVGCWVSGEGMVHWVDDEIEKKQCATRLPGGADNVFDTLRSFDEVDIAVEEAQ